MAAFINDREFFGVLRECFGFLIAVFYMAFRAETEQRGRSKTLLGLLPPLRRGGLGWGINVKSKG